MKMVQKLTLEHAREAAKARGGVCLSDTYVNTMTHLRWRCHLGHEWTTCLSKIKNCGRWCPDCAHRRKLTIDAAHKVATERGGRCLSTEYVNCEALLQWECSKGHTWMASIHNIKNHPSWCPECAGVTKWTIEELEVIAVENGGHILSTEYVNSQTHMEWICQYGHKWSAVSNSIVQGSWCPICKESRGEREVYKWLTENNIEFKAEFSFPGCRYAYDFMIPSTGWLIEFDGVQHFDSNSFFHSKIPFEARREADRKKTLMAYSNGLTLLRIHHDDFDRLPELLPMILTRIAPQTVCSRVEEYEYLNLKVLSGSEANPILIPQAIPQPISQPIAHPNGILKLSVQPTPNTIVRVRPEPVPVNPLILLRTVPIPSTPPITTPPITTSTIQPLKLVVVH